MHIDYNSTKRKNVRWLTAKILNKKKKKNGYLSLYIIHSDVQIIQ